VILADTSAWAEYDRMTGSAVDHRMAEIIAADGPLAVTQPVAMEIIAGARDERRQADLTRMLERFPLRRFDADVDFAAAAGIYRRCRSVGITPRGLIDCMLVAVAWRHADTVLAYDVDLDRVCGVVGVPLDPSSLRDNVSE
jgi:predicted nucleic acid-binding protein